MDVDLYRGMKDQSKLQFETNDCSVIALSLLLGYPYRKVHHEYAICGREFRHGTFDNMTFGVLYRLGVTYRYYNRYDLKQMSDNLNLPFLTFKNIHPQLHPHEKYLARSERHCAAIIHGRTVDWAKEDQSREIISLIELKGNI